MEKRALEAERQERLRLARRVVIKVGTNVVTGVNGGICTEGIEPIVHSIARLREGGRQIVLVSSGAVGLGAEKLGLKRARLNDLVMRQACAAIGQSLLMRAYEQAFGIHDLKIAQVLLTEDDFKNRRRYMNLRCTMEKLLKLGVIPIANENDTVSTAELERVTQSAQRIFSDNDRLAALVMSKLEADALILLSDVDGLLRKHRSPDEIDSSDVSDGEMRVIPLVKEITPELKALASGPSANGRGGMLTKLEAAEIAMRAGGIAVIANGKRPDTLDRIFGGDEIGTAFVSTARMAGKRRWIAYAADVCGRVVVNAGAREAILRGKASLLTSGVVRIENHFDPLNVVSIVDCEGREFARGIVNCASTEAERLINARRACPRADQSKGRAQVLVTRDNIVLLEG